MQLPFCSSIGMRFCFANVHETLSCLKFWHDLRNTWYTDAKQVSCWMKTSKICIIPLNLSHECITFAEKMAANGDSGNAALIRFATRSSKVEQISKNGTASDSISLSGWRRLKISSVFGTERTTSFQNGHTSRAVFNRVELCFKICVKIWKLETHLQKNWSEFFFK